MTISPHRPKVALFLPSLAGGGAERSFVNLAIGLADKFETDLVLAKAEGPYLSRVPSTVRVIDLGARRVITSFAPLTRYLKRERPMAVISALDHANLVAMVASRVPTARTRSLISVQCTFEKPEKGATSLRLQAIPFLLGRLHRWADRIVAVSEGVADDIAESTGIPRERVDVIHNPVITPDLTESASKQPQHPWFDDTCPVVIGVGRLTAQKNFAMLIDAFGIVRRRRKIRLVILGEGEDRPALESQIRRAGLEDVVSLPGFIENPYACMARAAVFVLSSDFEGLPTVLIESLAVGTPVVATDCESGPREILRNGSLGQLVPVRDVLAMAEAIEVTLTNGRSKVAPEVLRPYTLGAVVSRFQQAILDA